MRARLWVVGWPPFAHPAPESTPTERRWWLLMLTAAWVTMGGGILASSALITDQVLLGELALVLIVSFPIAYRMHFSRLPRFYVNYATLLAAVVLGYWQMRGSWPPGGGAEEISRLALSYRTLVCLFYWIMVWRGFAVRTITDLAQSAIPAISGVLLVLIAQPQPVVMAGTTMIVLGTLALLSGEHLRLRLARIDALVPRASVRGGRWRPALNSWLWLSLAALVAGGLVAMVAARIEPTNETGRWLRRELAWRLAQLMINENPMSLPEPLMWLGGPSPRTRNQVLLSVRSDTPLKMRRTVYDEYTGRAWRVGRRHWKLISPGADGWQLPPPETVGLSFRATDTQEVTVTSHHPFANQLPIPWYPLSVRADLVSVRQDYSGMIMFGGWLMPGRSYTATIAYPDTLQQVVPPDTLRAAGIEPALQLPDTLPARVRDLAREMAAGSDNPRDIAISIEGRLKTDYAYALQAPELPQDADFVDHFLFESKRGYCTHFASAMVVLLRCVGVPARMPAGFTAGEFDEDSGIYVIRDQDAHTWVEGYLPGTGWVDFDPTPLSQEVDRSISGVLSRLPETVGAGLVAAGRWVVSNVLRLGLVIGVVLLVLLAAVRLPRWWWRRIRFLPAGASAAERVRHAYGQALRWLALAGAPRQASAAPWEYCSATSERLPSIAQDLAALTAKYVTARYSSTPLTDGDWLQAREALVRLRERLFGRQRQARPTGT